MHVRSYAILLVCNFLKNINYLKNIYLDYEN